MSGRPATGDFVFARYCGATLSQVAQALPCRGYKGSLRFVGDKSKGYRGHFEAGVAVDDKMQVGAAAVTGVSG